MPSTRTKFWAKKLEGNKRRDQYNNRELQDLGWSSLVLWECKIRREANWLSSAVEFLEAARSLK